VTVSGNDAACGGNSSGSTCRHPHISTGTKISSKMITEVIALVRDRTSLREAIGIC
jgi:hypothetical protein